MVSQSLTFFLLTLCVTWMLGHLLMSFIPLLDSYHQFSRSVVSDSATPWTAARQASQSITNSQSLLKLTSINSVMPSNHLILSHPLLLPPSIFPSISSVQFSCSVMSNSVTPWTAPCKPSLSITNSCRSLRLTSIESVMPSSHLPSPPAPNPSQHQSLFQWVNSLHEVAKVLEFQL